jgi:hypothetical protein
MVDLRLNDIVNESYTLLFALSNFVAPLAGTYMYEQIGMRRTCDVFACMNIGVGVICVIFNCGFSVYSENRAFANKLAVLQGEEEEVEAGAPARKTFARGGGTFHSKKGAGGKKNQFNSIYMRPKK